MLCCIQKEQDNILDQNKGCLEETLGNMLREKVGGKTLYTGWLKIYSAQVKGFTKMSLTYLSLMIDHFKRGSSSATTQLINNELGSL